MAQLTTPPAANIEDCDQTEPALSGEDAGGIGDPDFIGTTDSETGRRFGAIGLPCRLPVVA